MAPYDSPKIANNYPVKTAGLVKLDLHVRGDTIVPTGVTAYNGMPRIHITAMIR